MSRPQPLRPRPLTLKLPHLLALAEGRPQVQALKSLVAKQEKAVDLARKEYYPDVTLGMAYGFRENRESLKRPDMFTSTVTVNLPIWHASKIKPKIREEELRQSAAQKAYQSGVNQLQAAIKDRYAKLERLSQQITLFDQGILPQARHAAAAALASYRVGTTDFSMLYQSQIAVRNAELQLQEYLKEFEELWAELEWLVGQELPRRAGGKK